MPEFHAAQAPRNQGQRYPDPPSVEEIIAAGLRINEALSLTETGLDERRGSILSRHGKTDRRRELRIGQ
jgi:site-specific recombinase XerD